LLLSLVTCSRPRDNHERPWGCQKSANYSPGIVSQDAHEAGLPTPGPRFEQRDCEDERIAHALKDESDLAIDLARKGDFAHRDPDSREERSKWFDTANVRDELNEGGLLRRGQAGAKHRDEVGDLGLGTAITGKGTQLIVAGNEHCADPVESGYDDSADLKFHSTGPE